MDSKTTNIAPSFNRRKDSANLTPRLREMTGGCGDRGAGEFECSESRPENAHQFGTHPESGAGQ
jgi:hypothetical protein